MGAPGTKSWNDAKAWDITQRLDAELRRLQLEGWRTSRTASPRFDKLLEGYREAQETHNMDLLERTCYETLKLAYHDHHQQQKKREAAERNGKVD